MKFTVSFADSFAMTTSWMVACGFLNHARNKAPNIGPFTILERFTVGWNSRELTSPWHSHL
jgi:hypothetical protein